jgi:hypothetical protein
MVLHLTYELILVCMICTIHIGMYKCMHIRLQGEVATSLLISVDTFEETAVVSVYVASLSSLGISPVSLRSILDACEDEHSW